MFSSSASGFSLLQMLLSLILVYFVDAAGITQAYKKSLSPAQCRSVCGLKPRHSERVSGQVSY